MGYQRGLTVSLRNGANGSAFKEYSCESGTRTRVYIETIEGAVICPEITIDAAHFDWSKADGLWITVQYGAFHELTVWAPDPFRGRRLSGRVDWTFQIPGTIEWDKSNPGSISYVYQFRQVQTWSCNMNECPDLKKDKEKLLREIRISMKRKSLVANIGAADIPVQPQQTGLSQDKICHHYLTQHQTKDPVFSVSPTRIDVPLLPEGIVLHPRPDAFEDLKKPEGNWIRFVFEFRHPSELLKLLGGSFVKSPPTVPSKTRGSRLDDTGEDLASASDESSENSRDSSLSSDAELPSLIKPQALINRAINIAESTSTSTSLSNRSEETSDRSRGSSNTPLQEKHKRSSSALNKSQKAETRGELHDSMRQPKSSRLSKLESYRAARVGNGLSTSETVLGVVEMGTNASFKINNGSRSGQVTTIPSPVDVARSMPPGNPVHAIVSLPVQREPSLISTSEAQKACLNLKNNRGHAATPQASPDREDTGQGTLVYTASTDLNTENRGIQNNPPSIEGITADNAPVQSQFLQANVTDQEHHPGIGREGTEHSPLSTIDREIKELQDERRRLQQQLNEKKQRVKEQLLAECEQLKRELERPSPTLMDA